MKSKKALTVGLLAISACLGILLFLNHSPLTGNPLQTEWLENQFPTKPDDDTILPYGYTLGSWPRYFMGEPIVTQLTYQKGPPQKFIQKQIQIWKPIEVELEILGPTTILDKFGASRWKECFTTRFSCKEEKKKYLQQIFPDQSFHSYDETRLTWIDSLDSLSPRGTHLEIKSKTYQIDRYTLITESGATQTFSFKSVQNPVGLQARELFLKTLSSLKVKEDLASSRAWIQSKVSRVQLDEVKKIIDPKLRLDRLIQIQNWIYSLLSVDPTHVEPFFHLAGVTHLLAMDLMRSKQKYFENQEAWIGSLKPLFETLIAYVKDFPNSQNEVKNIELLLQDILLEQNKASR